MIEKFDEKMGGDLEGVRDLEVVDESSDDCGCDCVLGDVVSNVLSDN